MGFNADWFSIFGRPQVATASSSGGAGIFPGDPPNRVFYKAPYYYSLGEDIVRFRMPEAANLSQLVISSWQFGATGGASQATDAKLFINNALVASKTWDADDRVADRGSVWDLNITVLQGSLISFNLRQWRGLNPNTGAFQVALIGTWLRDI